MSTAKKKSKKKQNKKTKWIENKWLSQNAKQQQQQLSVLHKIMFKKFIDNNN